MLRSAVPLGRSNISYSIQIDFCHTNKYETNKKKLVVANAIAYFEPHRQWKKVEWFRHLEHSNKIPFSKKSFFFSKKLECRRYSQNILQASRHFSELFSAFIRNIILVAKNCVNAHSDFDEFWVLEHLVYQI